MADEETVGLGSQTYDYEYSKPTVEGDEEDVIDDSEEDGLPDDDETNTPIEGDDGTERVMFGETEAPDEQDGLATVEGDEENVIEEEIDEEGEDVEPGEVLNDNKVLLPCIGAVTAGEPVVIMLQNGVPTVLGSVGSGDAEKKAREAAAKEAAEAKEAADAVNGLAGEAKTAATAANTNAQAAQVAAAAARTEAASATAAAGEVKGSLAEIAEDLDSVKTEEDQTLADAIGNLTEKQVEVMAAGYASSDDLKEQEIALRGEIERSAGKVQTTMQAEYARKTDLTEAKSDLQSQITQTAGKISTSVSSIADAMANLQSAEVQAAIQAAKAQLETATTNLVNAKTALITAQTEAANATANAAIAQNLASDANAALVIAQDELEDAQAYRDKLVELNAPTDDIESAEQAVTAAQNAVTTAQAAANEAAANAEAANAESAQAAAAVTTAEGNVATAQADYDLAANGLHEASCTGIEQTSDEILLRATKSETEELDKRVTSSESALSVLADSISSIVRSGDETSLVKQDESGLFYFDIEALQSSADETAKGLADLLKAIGDIDADSEETLLGKLSKLESELASVGMKTEYVTVSEYEDEPCIILGETDSTFKLLITNTRIVFLEGSTETTYIRNNTLVTNNVEVKSELRQGKWMWSARANGNLGLVWIGGDE